MTQAIPTFLSTELRKGLASTKDRESVKLLADLLDAAPAIEEPRWKQGFDIVVGLIVSSIWAPAGAAIAWRSFAWGGGLGLGIGLLFALGTVIAVIIWVVSVRAVVTKIAGLFRPSQQSTSDLLGARTLKTTRIRPKSSESNIRRQLEARHSTKIRTLRGRRDT